MDPTGAKNSRPDFGSLSLGTPASDPSGPPFDRGPSSLFSAPPPTWGPIGGLTVFLRQTPAKGGMGIRVGFAGTKNRLPSPARVRP